MQVSGVRFAGKTCGMTIFLPPQARNDIEVLNHIGQCRNLMQIHHERDGLYAVGSSNDDDNGTVKDVIRHLAGQERWPFVVFPRGVFDTRHNDNNKIFRERLARDFSQTLFNTDGRTNYAMGEACAEAKKWH